MSGEAHNIEETAQHAFVPASPALLPSPAASGPDSTSGADTSGTICQDPQAIASASKKSKELAPVQPPLEPPGYQIIRRLGRGTFGEVWLAKQLFDGSNFGVDVLVAIKFFMVHNRQQVGRLVEEAKILASLRSDPRIVYFVDHEAESNPPYIVMDFAEQGSLLEKVKVQQPMPVAEALALFVPIVEAMAFVHAKGIRHCDLKPGNILLDAAGRPKVADFGQAHLSVEATAQALGTFFYMAPEQASDLEHVPDARWDVYGLGAIFYALVTGRPPRYSKQFTDELSGTATFAEKLQLYRDRVAQAPKPTEHRRLYGMDRPLAEIIDRCLAVEPNERLRDAGDVLAALRQRERRRRQRPLYILAVLAPLLLMAAIGVFGKVMVNTAADRAERDLKNRILQNNTITANLLANVLEDRLTQASHKIQVLSQGQLRGYLLAILTKKNPRSLPEESPNVLENHLKVVAGFDDLFGSLTVFDGEGKFFAAYNPPDPRDSFCRYLHDRDYSYRDYFNRSGDQPPGQGPLHEGKYSYKPNLVKDEDVPYIGQPFVATSASQFRAITVSTSIRDDAGKPVGLLIGSINLEKLYKWIDPIEEQGGCAVVLDRNGYCLHHLKIYRDLLQPFPTASPEKRTAPLFQRVLNGETGSNEQHLDPYTEKTHLAAHVPVSGFGWGVVVQHDREKSLAEIEGIRDEMYGKLVLGLLISGLALSTFFGCFLWFVLRKERLTSHTALASAAPDASGACLSSPF